ncbi:hypothetical protein LQZ19_01430 [Treponema primitia]|uniref:hypothetical protein n=1 Tax=Treponema primitia TaxID=88058 RepID=UPI0039807C27
MAKKILLLGMLVTSLAFGFKSAACDELASDDSSHGSYTIEFKVEYFNGFINSGAITQIEFINGSSSGSPVLATETVNLVSRDLSNVYRVSGFSNKEGDGRIFGVRVTLKSGKTHFDWSTAAEDGAKVKVRFSGPLWVMQFSGGNW